MAQLTQFEKAGHIVAESSFQSRVKGAMIGTALNVKGEEYDTVEQDTPQGAREVPAERSRKRASLADLVLQNPNTALERFTNVLAVYPGIITKYASTIDVDTDAEDFDKQLRELIVASVRQIGDSDIEFVIASVWDDLAGVNGWDGSVKQ